jgi:hypothetical protein
MQRAFWKISKRSVSDLKLITLIKGLLKETYVFPRKTSRHHRDKLNLVKDYRKWFSLRKDFNK